MKKWGLGKFLEEFTVNGLAAITDLRHWYKHARFKGIRRNL